MTNNEFIGLTNKMNCGMTATIIAYRSYKDIDVEFENGVVRTHRAMCHFKSGSISPTGKNRPLRIGDTFVNGQGLTYKVIDFIDHDNVTIQFEDGTIIKNRSSGDVRQGISTNPNYDRYFGVSRFIRKLGCNATIISRNNNFANKITIQDEHGTVYGNQRLSTFLNGGFNREMRIGERQKMNCGMSAEIIDIKTANNITIRFDDGSTVKTNSKSFYAGTTKHPTIRKGYVPKNHVYETATSIDGYKATIIEYTDPETMTIEFEDKSRRTDVGYNNFFQNAFFSRKYMDETYYNKWFLQKNGLHCRIYKRYTDTTFDVVFEDGTIVTHEKDSRINYKIMTNGHIQHPDIYNLGGHSRGFLHEKYTVNGFAFEYHDTSYFDVSYIDNDIEIRTIMSVKEMQ